MSPSLERRLPQGEEKTARVRSMFDAIAPRYDLVNRLMTFGLDQSWRRDTVAALALPEGSLLLDVACGTGDLTRLAQRRGYRVIGADLSAGMLSGQPHRRAPAAGELQPTPLPRRHASTGSSAGTPCAISRIWPAP